MFINDENLVIEEVDENAEELAAEETVDGVPEAVVEEPEKKYTEADLHKRIDEILPKKIARERSKLHKEYEEKYAPYREAESVLNAGLQTSNITEATAKMREFYKDKGLEIPQYQAPVYSEEDLKVLAGNEAQKVIESGLEDVIEEVDRLAKKGVENMSPREKLVFGELSAYKAAESQKMELLELGVKDDVISSREFREFAKQFNSQTPITKVYQMYEKLNKPHVEQIGTMKNPNPGETKKIYTSDEVDKLTSKDLDDPNVFKRVRESMFSW